MHLIFISTKKDQINMMTDAQRKGSIATGNDLAGGLDRRVDGLLASADLAEDVAELDGLDAYYLLRGAGLGQVVPILLALQPEQLQTCVDLDCWSLHDFSADSLDEWLTAFSLAGPESLAEGFFRLDYVVQLLYLAQTVIVYDPDTDEVPPVDEEDGPLRAMTPDGFYLLELKTELKLQLHPFSVLDSLYQYDLQRTHQLLSEVRVDLSMQIEEEALRFRNGRLLDLGFTPPDEAAELFSRPTSQTPVVQLDSGGYSARLPAVYAGFDDEEGLFKQALALVQSQNLLLRLEQELIWTTNTAIIAYGEKTQDIEHIAAIARRVRDTISLGLESLLYKAAPEILLGGQAGVQAVELLKSHTVQDLFKHGFTAASPLQKEAYRALDDPYFRHWFELETAEQSEEQNDLSDRAFLAALLGRHPLQAGFDIADPERVQGFNCLADVDVARVRLKRLVAKIGGTGQL